MNPPTSPPAENEIASARGGQPTPDRALELLSPAGDRTCITAAVENGANAVYFGLECGFNARARATNLHLDSLPEVMSYLHERGVRGYVTLNTLVFPSELPAIEEHIVQLTAAGIDAVLIGPHDLSCSLGIPEQWDHPTFLDACETIFRKARAAGIGAGIHFWGDVSQQSRFLKLGANMLIHSADISLFQKHLRLELDAIRSAAGLSADAATSATTLV